MLQGVSVIQHWAVKVGDTWYEIEKGDQLEDRNIVIKTRGEVSRTGACYYGSESVGWTNRSWEEIDKFSENWVADNPDYLVFADNCRGFSRDMVRWLTEEGPDLCQVIPANNRRSRVKIGRSQSLNRKLKPVDEVEEIARNFTATTLTRSQMVNDGQAIASAHVFKVFFSFFKCIEAENMIY